MPMHKDAWRQPSQRQSIFGVENKVKFCITAVLNDGFVVWRGWFDDRSDADMFLFSIVSGSINYEKELWNLPNPVWFPEFAAPNYRVQHSMIDELYY